MSPEQHKLEQRARRIKASIETLRAIEDAVIAEHEITAALGKATQAEFENVVGNAVRIYCAQLTAETKTVSAPSL